VLKKNIYILLIIISTQLFSFLPILEITNIKNCIAPKAVEISPDGKTAVIVNLEGMDFWLANASNGQIIEKIKFFPTPATGWNYTTKKPIKSFAQKPVECAFSPDSRYLWISLHNAAAVVVYDTKKEFIFKTVLSEKISIFNLTANNKKIMEIPKISVGNTPKVIKITPDGRLALVANWHSSSVSVINTADGKVLKNIKLGGKNWYIPRGICISSDSKTAYIANMGGGNISVINLASLEILPEIKASSNPRHILLSKNDQFLYISDNISGKILKIDITNGQKIFEASAGKMARTITMTSDEKILFAVSYEESSCTVFNMENFEILQKIKIYAPMGLAITPDNTRLWISSYKGGFVKIYGISTEK